MEMKFVDLHCDTISQCVARPGIEAVPLRRNSGHIDIEKLQKGGALVQFFAIFILTHGEMEKSGLNMDPYTYFNFVYEAYQREMKANADAIATAMNYDDIMANKAKGLMSSVLTIEDGVPVEGKIERIDEFYKKGVRLITLTWNYENSLAFPNSRDNEKMQLGLKPFGIEAVRRMNELGILVDVSHLSDGGFYDVAKYSQKPFVASHSCARALCSHPRCMTDDMLRVLGEKGGVCGINFCASFLRDKSNDTTIEDIVTHARHIAKVAGIDALALGSDFDGIGSNLEFKDYTGMPSIADALSKHFTASEVDKISSGNALRVIRESMK